MFFRKQNPRKLRAETKRKIEKALRAEGFSRTDAAAATAIAARFFNQEEKV